LIVKHLADHLCVRIVGLITDNACPLAARTRGCRRFWRSQLAATQKNRKSLALGVQGRTMAGMIMFEGFKLIVPHLALANRHFRPDERQVLSDGGAEI
jgi:hypothetical protein